MRPSVLAVWQLSLNSWSVLCVDDLVLTQVTSLLWALVGGLVRMMCTSSLNLAVLVNRKLLISCSVGLNLRHTTPKRPLLLQLPWLLIKGSRATKIAACSPDTPPTGAPERPTHAYRPPASHISH
jgi:hypothetical protein